MGGEEDVVGGGYYKSLRVGGLKKLVGGGAGIIIG